MITIIVPIIVPYLFAVFVDSVVQRVKAPGSGCYIKFVCVSIILYADDILLLPSSVTALQQLLRVCKAEFACLDMAVVISACMRIVSRHTVKCMNIRIVSVRETLCCNKIKYLGIDLIAAIVSSNFYMITLNASFVEPSMQFLGKLRVLPHTKL